MTVTAALAADLGILSVALDDSGIDVADSVRQLAVSAAVAIPTYLGLSVTVLGSVPPFAFTSFADGVLPDDVLTSLALNLPGGGAVGDPWAAILVLYAGSPGTFIDLAADLAWYTAWPSSGFALDQHLQGLGELVSAPGLLELSAINQAIGKLIGQGHLPEHAERELASRAAGAGISRHATALRILAEPRPR